MTLAIWAVALAIVFNGVLNMTRNEFLTSIANSMSGMATSLTTIAASIANHPATGNEDFDPDGALQNAADQLSSLATRAGEIANAVNPATPGGINDPGNGGSGTVTPPSDTTAQGGQPPADPGASQGGNSLNPGAADPGITTPGEQAPPPPPPSDAGAGDQPPVTPPSDTPPSDTPPQS